MRTPKIFFLAGIAVVGLILGARALGPKRPMPVATVAPEPLPVATPSPPALPLARREASPLPHAQATRPAAADADAVVLAPGPAAGPAPSAPSRTEADLMARLRDLAGSNPELSLRLAREGNHRFGDSADAAERSWFIVRSLMDLGHPGEARTEARVLLDRYPTSSWAQDVHRHMFVNPPSHPLERGYGKQLELE